MRGLLIGDDARVADWAFSTYGFSRTLYDAAIGIVENGALVGAILFQGFNDNDVHLSYYGQNTVTLGIIRNIARICINHYNVSRVTVVTGKNRRKLIRALRRVGFEIECVMRRYYGKTDGSRHAAMRLVMFRERVEQIARIS